MCGIYIRNVNPSGRLNEERIKMLLSILLGLTGIAMFVYPSFAAFERRTDSGVEVFNDYSDMVDSASLEGILKFMGVFFIIGSLILAFAK